MANQFKLKIVRAKSEEPEIKPIDEDKVYDLAYDKFAAFGNEQGIADAMLWVSKIRCATEDCPVTVVDNGNYVGIFYEK